MMAASKTGVWSLRFLNNEQRCRAGTLDLRAVPIQDRESLIDLYKTKSKDFEFETVEHGMHTLQYGFPLSNENTIGYFMRNINFFERNLRCG